MSCNGNLTLTVSTGGNLKANLFSLSGFLNRISHSVPGEELVFLFDDQGFCGGRCWPTVHLTT